MIVILSPSKTMGSLIPKHHQKLTVPECLEFSEAIVAILKKKSPTQLSKLMKINPQLAQLTFERFQQWQQPFHEENSTPAAFSYIGEAFRGLDAYSMTDTDLSFAQDHLRIISGLYGVLRPLDLVMPYRLEMALQLAPGKSKSLYEYWRRTISDSLGKALVHQNDDILINLASLEYSKSIDANALKARIITPVFKEYKNNKPVTVTIYAKKARGLMARFIIQNQLKLPDELKLFDQEGYYYTHPLSTETEMVFTR